MQEITRFTYFVSTISYEIVEFIFDRLIVMRDTILNYTISVIPIMSAIQWVQTAGL
jgi:hypothetical protein